MLDEEEQLLRQMRQANCELEACVAREFGAHSTEGHGASELRTLATRLEAHQGKRGAGPRSASPTETVCYGGEGACEEESEDVGVRTTLAWGNFLEREKDVGIVLGANTGLRAPQPHELGAELLLGQSRSPARASSETGSVCPVLAGALNHRLLIRSPALPRPVERPDRLTTGPPSGTATPCPAAPGVERSQNPPSPYRKKSKTRRGGRPGPTATSS